MRDFPQALHAAIAAHQAGDLDAAAAGYRALLREQPRHPDLLHLLGVVAYQQGRHDEARDLITRAIAIHPGSGQYHSNLGNIWQAMQRPAEAVPCYEQALNLDGDHPVVLGNLGNALLSLRRDAEALAVFQRALALAPGDPTAAMGCGLALRELERPAEAMGHFIDVLERDPESVPAHVNLGNVLRETGHLAEALQQYAWVLQREPAHLEANYSMALTRRLAGDVTGALVQLQHCLALDESYATAHHAMVTILETEADHGATLEAFRAALALLPHAPQLHSVLAYSSDFDPTLDANGQQAVRKDWYARQIAPMQTPHLQLYNDRAPERRLRIGFIPGRFYRNASVYAYLPVLLQLDTAEFEIWCYDAFYEEDEFTAQIRAHAGGWYDISRMSDRQVAERIRDDRIDILVDLFAHAGANRLSIYAHRPAPVQVTAWGHANGTGMADMDYLFSDPVSIPPAEVGYYAEHVRYLPCQLSYWLPENAPPVASLPIEKNGHATFGCFNRMIKVSDAVLELWAELLASMPGSRLVLKAAELKERVQQDRVLAIFARHGVLPGRLSFYPGSDWYDHLERYAEVDIALDPFPMGGGVTTLDALWMGIPVLCLRGDTLGKRITSAIMTAVGLGDWVTDNPAEYLIQARTRAADPAALAHLRRSLRLRMAASPLASPEYYVGCVQDSLRAFWRQWCGEPGSRLPQPVTAEFEVAAHAAAADQLWKDFLHAPASPQVAARIAAMLRRAGKQALADEMERRGA